MEEYGEFKGFWSGWERDKEEIKALLAKRAAKRAEAFVEAARKTLAPFRFKEGRTFMLSTSMGCSSLEVHWEGEESQAWDCNGSPFRRYGRKGDSLPLLRRRGNPLCKALLGICEQLSLLEFEDEEPVKDALDGRSI